MRIPFSVRLNKATVASLALALVQGAGLFADVQAYPIDSGTIDLDTIDFEANAPDSNPDSHNIAPNIAQATPDTAAPDTAVSTNTAASLNIVVGVVQSSDNADQWQAIVERLEVAGIAYRVIDWQQIEQNTALDEISVIFLPDVEEITSGQVLFLQNWINRGGGVIVSGPTGRTASSGVQRSLQSLLGAYWVTSLADPVRLQPTVLNSQRWLRQGDTESQVLGGSLMPTGLGSQSVATWSNTRQSDNSSNSSSSAADSSEPNTVAIVTTRQTVFLGWRWGNTATSSIDFDSRWLRAALSRFEEFSPVMSASPAVSEADSQRTAPAPAAPAPAAPARANARSLLPPRSTLPPRLLPPVPPERPVAPPGLRVEPGAAPITIVDSIAMQQELKSLIGRFESALLAASSADMELATQNKDQELLLMTGTGLASTGLANADLADPDRININLASADLANIDPLLPIATDSATPTGLDDPILQEARQKLKAFSDLVRQQEYAAARDQWLQARQLLWDNFPTDRALAPTEIRAVWLDRETIVNARSRQGLAQIFDRLAAAGINTVFFETVNAGYPIYPSTVAPQQNPLTRRWDPLEAAVELAHDRGMELHAWVWTFAVGNEAHNRIVNLPLEYPGPIVSVHPDWASYDRQGNLILPGQEEAFLDPANPAARRYLLQLFEEIVTRYDVDGLQLDYIRYPFQGPNAAQTQGYGRAARQQFQRLTGIDPITLSPGDRAWQQWMEFRVNQVDSFVAETSDLVHRLNPDLILSTAVFPMPTQERIRKIQQNWEAWAQRGDVDMIVVMTYATDTNRLQQLATPWLSEESVDLGATLVLPGLMLLNLPDQAAFDQIQALRDLPSGGYALFAMAHLRDPLQGILHRTQGQGAEAIPYRQPFTAAADRFAALQREWNFLLSQNQLWMREPDLQAWRNQTAALQTAFTELADNPSDRQLKHTQELLQTFQSDFGDWMYSQSLTQDYRVQTWKNRLMTIANLLDYGGRVALERWE